MISPGMAVRTKLWLSSRRPSPTSPGWRGATGWTCSCACSRWPKWKPRSASGFAASAIYPKESAQHRLRQNASAALDAGIRPHFGIANTEQPAILRTEFEFSNWPAFAAIHQQGRESVRLAGKFLAPLPQRDQYRKHSASLRCQHIFLVGAAVGSRHRHQDAVVDQRAQPDRQDIFRQTDVLLEFAEAADAHQGVPDDQQRPPVADHVQRSRDRAFRLFKTCAFHHGVLRTGQLFSPITALCSCIIKPDVVDSQPSLLMQPWRRS